MGWAINAGGVISRTIFGLSDDDVAGFMTTSVLPDGVGTIMKVKDCLSWVSVGGLASHSNVTSPCNGASTCVENPSDFYKMVNINKGLYDDQYDIFNYNFDGYSGKFIIGKDGSILQIPQTNLKIEKLNGTGLQLQGFIVTTPEGIKYLFDQEEYNNVELTTYSSFGQITTTNDGPPPGRSLPYVSPAGFNQSVNSWYLTKIYTPSNSESITFTYQGGVLVYDSYMGENYVTGPTGTPRYENTTAHNGALSGFIPNEMRLGTIHLPDNTVIDFEYDQNIPRYDVGSSNVKDMRISAYALNKISISNNGNLRTQYSLNQAYITNHGRELYNSPQPSPTEEHNYRLILESIVKVNGSSIEPFYSFEYDGYQLPGRFSSSQDHWGYYNAAINKSLITGAPLLNSDRDPHENAGGPFAGKGGIKKIIYPTGGYTEFEFENNGDTYGLVGGIRIKRTTDFDGVSHLNDITTEYAYSGVTYRPHPVYSYPMSWVMPGEFPQTNMFYSSFASNTLGLFQGSPASYASVSVSKTKNTSSLGKTVCYFTNNGAQLFFGSDPDYAAGSLSQPYIPIPFLDWANGLKSKEEYYDDQNSLLKSITYDYDVTMDKIVNSNFRSLKVGLIAGPYICNSSYCNSDCNISVYSSDGGSTILVEEDRAMYSRKRYYPYTGRAYLINIKEIDYDKNGNKIEKNISSVYNTNYHLLIQQLTKNSKGDELKNHV